MGFTLSGRGSSRGCVGPISMSVSLLATFQSELKNDIKRSILKQ